MVGTASETKVSYYLLSSFVFVVLLAILGFGADFVARCKRKD